MNGKQSRGRTESRRQESSFFISGLGMDSQDLKIKADEFGKQQAALRITERGRERERGTLSS